MHAPPQSCSHQSLSSPPCTCPEYEPTSDSDQICDLCDHQVEWHLPPLALSLLEGRDLKARGEEALEHCKDRLGKGGEPCPCPVFVLGKTANECSLCGHKKGWHKFKDAAPMNTQIYSPISPSTSSGGSYSSATSPFTTNPFPHPSAALGSDSEARRAPYSPGGARQSTSDSWSSVSSPITSPGAYLPPSPQQQFSTPPRADNLPLRRPSVQAMSQPQPGFYPREIRPVDVMDDVEVISPASRRSAELFSATPSSARLDKGKGKSVESPASGLTSALRLNTIISESTSSSVSGDSAPSTPLRAVTHGVLPMSIPGAYDEDDEDDPTTCGRDAPEDPEYYRTQPVQAIRQASPSSSRLLARSPPRGRGHELRGVPIPATFQQHLMEQGTLSSPPSASSPVATITSTTPATPITLVAPEEPAPRYRPPVPPSRRKASTAATSSATSSSATLISPSVASPSVASSSSAVSPPAARPSPVSPPVSEFGNSTEESTVIGIARPAFPQTSSQFVNAEPAEVSAVFGSATVERLASLMRTPSATSSTDAASIVSTTVPRPVATPANDAAPQWRTYESKNMLLAISPPLLDGRRIQPGQVFSMQLKLGPKVSLSNFDKIEVKLVGNSFVYGEPPDSHDFMSLRASVFPASPDIQELGHGQRAFAWTMTVPDFQTCDCRPDPLPLPSSYGHSNFRVDYRVELIAKKHKRFNMNNTEKTNVHFPFFAPFVDIPDLAIVPSNTTMKSGVDGPWRTISNPKIVLVDGQQANVTGSELAWQVLPPEGNLVRVPYRVTLNFGQLLPSQYLNDQVLGRLEDSFRISLSRRITLSKSGRKPSKEDVLPALRVAFKEVKDRAEVRVDEAGVTMWRYGGYLEVAIAESRSMSTCNASVRYMLTAKCLQTAGLSAPIDLIARNLSLELPTAHVMIQRNSSVSSTASGAAPPARALPQPLTPLDRAPPAIPAAPIASTSQARSPRQETETLRGYQLSDGLRPPSTAGSSVYRIPSAHGTGYPTGVPSSLESAQSFWPQDRPQSVRSHTTSPTYSDDPPDLLPPGPTAATPSTHALELPPDFDEFVPEHEPTPAYEEAVRQSLVEQEDAMTDQELMARTVERLTRALSV